MPAGDQSPEVFTVGQQVAALRTSPAGHRAVRLVVQAVTKTTVQAGGNVYRVPVNGTTWERVSGRHEHGVREVLLTVDDPAVAPLLAQEAISLALGRVTAACSTLDRSRTIVHADALVAAAQRVRDLVAAQDA